jgi:hypothetical protein
MKMGTIRTPWRYDAAARHALQSANLRRPAILHYASGEAFPISQGGPVIPLESAAFITAHATSRHARDWAAKPLSWQLPGVASW